ncbi:MAG: ETC complex I subunit [Sphingomonas sp.]|nr:ETC complex I subunit [Sphingomonas sp.]
MSVRIYRKVENPMQWGRRNGKGWLLEYDVPYACRADPLTGWQGSGDTRGQIQLSFPTLEAAIAYAEHEGLDYHVVHSGTRRLKIQSYADNFTMPRQQ